MADVAVVTPGKEGELIDTSVLQGELVENSDEMSIYLTYDNQGNCISYSTVTGSLTTIDRPTSSSAINNKYKLKLRNNNGTYRTDTAKFTNTTAWSWGRLNINPTGSKGICSLSYSIDKNTSGKSRSVTIKFMYGKKTSTSSVSIQQNA